MTERWPSEPISGGELALLTADLVGPSAPAVSVGVLMEGSICVSAQGVVNVAEQHLNTPAEAFEIGSITKVLTATAVMRLVDRGLFSLTTPIRQLLPHFRLGSGSVDALTVGHLLSHQGGIDAAYVGETGSESVQELVGRLRDTDLAFAPGSAWEYSNLGFVTLGAILERTTGLPYSEVMATEVLTPLGDSVTTIDAPAAPKVVGHLPTGEGRFEVQQSGRFPGFAPAGSTPRSTAAGLLSLIAPHLNEGRAADGSMFLTRDATLAMQAAHAPIPANPDRKAACGLGWTHYRLVDGRTVLGHGGSTFGFLSYLIAVPSAQVAVAILINSLGAGDALRTLGDRVLQHVLGVSLYGST